MTSPWPMVKLEEVCNFYSGSTPNRKNREYWEPKEIPWFTIDDFRCQGKFISTTEQSVSCAALTETSLKTVPSNCVLVCCTASVGEVCINLIDLTMNQQFNGLGILNPETLDVNYLYYSMIYSSDSLRELGRATTVSFVSQTKLKSFEIPLPPLDEQKRIVAKLDEALGVVEELKVNTAQSKTELDAFWQATLTQTFSKDWPIVKLEEICTTLIDGDWIESKDQSQNGIRLVQTGNIGIGMFLDKEDKARFISQETFERLKCNEIYEGDVLVSRLPDPIGRSCLLPNLDSIAITGVDCAILRFSDAFTPKFFVYFSQSKNYLAEAKSLATGTTRLRLSRSKLSQIEIPFPPLDEQKRIVAKLDEIKSGFDRQREILLSKELETERLRSSILTAAFSGEL